MAHRSFTACMLAAAVLLFVTSAEAQTDPEQEIARDLVHSDLPLFGGGSDDMWPHAFYEADSFGCVSRVSFGDWALREANAEDGEIAQWYAFRNYGVFHCWANVYRAHEREELESAQAYPSFFVLLGTTEVRGRAIELWVIQIGARPGSEYVLLARAPSEGPVDSFTVLQMECPRANVRDAGALDILITRYCAINRRSDLTRFARRMAQRAPRGELTLVRDGENDE